MPLESCDQLNTAEEVKKIFAPVMEANEKIKVFVGQRVDLNESEVGRNQNRLSSELFEQLRSSAMSLDEERVDIPINAKGKPELAELEVLAVSAKDEEGKAISRTLFRQERGPESPVSVNLAGDLIIEQVNHAEKAYLGKNSEQSRDSGSEQSKWWENEWPDIDWSSIAEDYEDDDVVDEVDTAEITPTHIPDSADQADWRVELTEEEWPPEITERMEQQADASELVTEKSLSSSEENLSNFWKNVDAPAAEGESTRPAAEVTEETSTADSAPQSNTIATLLNRVAELDDGPTKELATKIAAELQAKESEIKAREEKVQGFKKFVKKAAANTIEAVRNPSPRNMATIALKGASAVADAGGRALKAAGQYLQVRAQKVEEYGMAKSALAIHKKGHDRTGEDSYSKDGYTVEKEDDSYNVLDSKQRSVMTFETNKKGQPVNVSQTEATQQADKQALHEIAKSSVILGSPRQERTYSELISTSADLVSEGLAVGDEIEGNDFKVSKKSKELIVKTKTSPSRSARIDRETGEITSDLNREDVHLFSERVLLATNQVRVEDTRARAKEQITV